MSTVSLKKETQPKNNMADVGGDDAPPASKTKFEQLESSLNALMDEQDNLKGLTQERGGFLSKMEKAADNTEQTINEFDSLLDKFEKELVWNKNEFTELDVKYKHLEQDKDELQTEGQHIYEKLNAAKQESNATITDKDLARAKFQNEETHDLLKRLKDDLQLANRRLETEKFNSSQAWDDLKKDLKKYREESAPHLEKINKLDQLKERRIKQWMAEHKNGSQLQLRLAQDALDFINLLQKNRDLTIKVQDAEIEMRDVAQSFEILGTQKSVRMEKLDKINQELQGISGDGGFRLKAAIPSLDLTVCDSDDVTFPEVSITRDWQRGGKTLHRCQKMMNLPKIVNQGIDCTEDVVCQAGKAEDVSGVVLGAEKEKDKDAVEYTGEDDGEEDVGSKEKLEHYDLRVKSPKSTLSHMESSFLTHKIISRLAGQTQHLAAAESATAIKKATSLHVTGSSHNPPFTKTSSRHRN